ncbi:MAG: hypothetical protein AB1758_03560 [Candidatus Eremiobacterota bacterium]
MPLPDPFYLSWENVHIVPICHYKMEFARAVEAACVALKPRQVAVELPDFLRERYLEAVGRLPFLSVLACEEAPRADEEATVSLYPVQPADPITEAVRWGLEHGLPVHFVDRPALGYPDVHESMPDSYSVHRIGLEQYYGAYRGSPGPRVPEDEVRDRHMAWAVGEKRLSHPGPLLLVCGMAHAAGILEHLARGTGEEASDPPPLVSVKIYNPSPESLNVLFFEAPVLMGLYQFQRRGAGPDKAWEAPPRDEPEPTVPTTELEQIDRHDAVAALERLLGMAEASPEEPHWSRELRRLMALKLARMQGPQLDINTLLGGGPQGPEVPEGAPRVPANFSRIFKFRDCNDRRPALRELFEKLTSEVEDLDRNRLWIRLWETAARHYEDNTGEKLAPWQLRTMTQFVRNYTLLTARLMPNLHQCLVGARGVADDNFGWEVFDVFRFYPWQDDSERYPPMHFEDDALIMAGIRVKRFRFRRRLPRLRERLVPMRSRRKKEQTPGEWSDEFRRGSSICSYPPEDIVIEDYGRYAQKKAILVLSEERTRVEPFTSSILDGIDMRETLRNWADGRKIYVRESQKVQGGTGSVVLIFDEDPGDDRYPWKMTWHGEHTQESDMAFFATPPNAKIVGPGIARCEYGGLMLTYPPRRLMDVWSDPFYLEACNSKAEMLLLAGLEYSEDKHVAYVAAKPPRSYFRSVASRLGRKIVYLPIGQLSPVSIKKIRVFHVLSGHHLRKIAKDYIW